MLIIELAKQSVQSDCPAHGECPRCSCRGWRKWGSPRIRSITDVSVGKVATQRYRCKSCGKTITARPQGVDRSERSHSFKALLGVLYALGLSHRSIEKVVWLFGYRVGCTSSWRDVQRGWGEWCVAGFLRVAREWWGWTRLG